MDDRPDIDALIERIRREAQRPEYQVAEPEPLEPLGPLHVGSTAEPARAGSGGTRSGASALLSGLIPISRTLDDFLLIQDDDAFLEQAYQVLLGRPADAVGAQYYGDMLRKGYGRTFVLAALAAARDPGGFRGRVAGMRLAPAIYNLWRVLRRVGLEPVGRWCNGAYFRRRQRLLVQSGQALTVLNQRDAVHALAARLDEASAEQEALRREAESERHRVNELVRKADDLQRQSDVQREREKIMVREADEMQARLDQQDAFVRAQLADTEIRSQDLAARIDNYYDAFETQCRGSEDEIRAGQYHYLAAVQALPDAVRELPVIDLGCGRGEWLALLREASIAGRGIDTSPTFAAHGREKGLDIIEGDALQVLRELPDASAAAITAFHIIEHLPFPILFQIIEEAARVITPGGLLILETPNPENVLVGSHTFYHDFSHRNPVTPTALQFLISYLGFTDIEVRRMHPYGEGAYIDEDSLAAQRLNGHLYGDQDFAVIAKRPAEQDPACS